MHSAEKKNYSKMRRFVITIDILLPNIKLILGLLHILCKFILVGVKPGK